ncbi:MAG: efflux RND transporter periplasmic adaptor subunit [Candidatus Omnitrophota bacterium]|nr:MAG: efflux RND transporter periplasmic adaptor subunit [Candidatus Omnitrophota bacterium]
MLRSKKICFILVILIAAAVLIMKKKDTKYPLQTAREITPEIGSIQSLISTTGIVEPQNRLEIKPPINGRIEEIMVSEGEKVKAGQTLALMSSTERAALLDAARAQGEESLKYWQEAYKSTPLIAPIDAEVIVRAVEPGQTVASGDVIVVLSDRLIVKAQVDETDIGRVKIGQAARVSLDAYPQIKVDAKVDHISYESEVVNNVTIYEVDILPKEIPEVFRSGMSANVDIVEVEKQEVLIVPLEAIEQTKEGAFVSVSQGPGEEPLRRKVKLGIYDEKNAEIVSGLSLKDKIIVKTQRYLPSRNNNTTSSPFMPFGRRRR